VCFVAVCVRARQSGFVGNRMREFARPRVTSCAIAMATAKCWRAALRDDYGKASPPYPAFNGRTERLGRRLIQPSMPQPRWLFVRSIRIAKVCFSLTLIARCFKQEAQPRWLLQAQPAIA